MPVTDASHGLTKRSLTPATNGEEAGDGSVPKSLTLRSHDPRSLPRRTTDQVNHRKTSTESSLSRTAAKPSQTSVPTLRSTATPGAGPARKPVHVGGSTSRATSTAHDGHSKTGSTTRQIPSRTIGQSRQPSTIVPQTASTVSGRSRTVSSFSSRAPTKASAGPTPQPSVANRLASPAQIDRHTRPDVSTDRSRLRDELLQLEILHEQARGSALELESAVNAHCARQRDHVSERQAGLMEILRRHYGESSLTALGSWAAEQSNRDPHRQIQRASSAISAIQQEERLLLAPEGCLTRFRDWLTKAEHARSRPRTRTSGVELTFIRPLGRAWERALQKSIQRLQVHHGVLQASCYPTHGSGIALVTQHHLDLSQTLLDQALAACEIEKTMCLEEQRYISTQADTVLGEWSTILHHTAHSPWRSPVSGEEEEKEQGTNGVGER